MARNPSGASRTGANLASGTEAIFRDPDPLEGDGSLLIPVVEAVEGRCLELGATTDGWSRILDLHASEHVRIPPEATGEKGRVDRWDFDTVVGACRTNPLTNVVSAARQALSHDGTLILGVDGWSNQLRVDGRSPVQAFTDIPRGNAWYVRRTLRKAGFDDVSLYGVFPSIAEPTYVYPLSSESVVGWFLDNRLNGWKKAAARVANSATIFDQGQPGYLAVCDRAAEGHTPASTLGRVSHNRVISFEFVEGELDHLRKIPRPRSTDATIRNEHRVLTALLDEVGERSPLGDTLPTSWAMSSPLGTVRLERPASILHRRTARPRSSHGAGRARFVSRLARVVPFDVPGRRRRARPGSPPPPGPLFTARNRGSANLRRVRRNVRRAVSR